MWLTSIMIIISAFIALNGLLYQPKKDPNDSVNWSNINFFGRVLFCLLVLLALLNIIKIYGDEKHIRMIYYLTINKKKSF